MNHTLATADIGLIQEILPHRYPFLLVDRVVEIDGHRSGLGIKNVTMNEPHMVGHFPGMPVMPGVLILEAMAQTASVIVGCGLGLEGKGVNVYLLSVDGGKFRRKVVPGDVLAMRLVRERGGPGSKIWKFRGEARVEGNLAAEMVLTAMLELT